MVVFFLILAENQSFDIKIKKNEKNLKKIENSRYINSAENFDLLRQRGRGGGRGGGGEGFPKELYFIKLTSTIQLQKLINFGSVNSDAK